MPMLIYTFPVLLISVLGCMYLHIIVKRNDGIHKGKKNERWEEWKRPMISRGALGVVSAMEFSFCLMFVALLVWSFSMYLFTGFSRITLETAAAQGRNMHDSLVMVSAGSGIAPFISIIRELIYRSTIIGSPTPSILLICSFKTSTDLTMLDLLLPVGNTISDLSKLNIKIEAFVTREKSSTANQTHIRTIWFKPNPSDFPVAPVLGPNGWLWLGAIISSSFIAFLMLIGIVTRYHIYPIEQSGMMYSVTWRALWNLLALCVSIAAACSGAVLWYKKNSSAKAKQVQIFDAPTPLSTPSSWLCKGQHEVESVPQESLVQATTVHYGRRADLKKMLLEIEGSSIGVMASGPSGLRHDVAAICSSADNLHFESISFSW